jgi:hypothetical protein
MAFIGPNFWNWPIPVGIGEAEVPVNNAGARCGVGRPAAPSLPRFSVPPLRPLFGRPLIVVITGLYTCI